MSQNAWKCLKMPENVWKCMKVSENARKCLEMPESVWKCLKVSENAWKCLKMPESVWKCTKVSENAGKCLKMPGSVWKCPKNPEFSPQSVCPLLFFLAVTSSSIGLLFILYEWIWLFPKGLYMTSPRPSVLFNFGSSIFIILPWCLLWIYFSLLGHHFILALLWSVLWIHFSPLGCLFTWIFLNEYFYCSFPEGYIIFSMNEKSMIYIFICILWWK